MIEDPRGRIVSTSSFSSGPAAEEEPAIASQIFGRRIGLARQFTADLVSFGESLGLIGPLEPPRMWSRHIVNSALVAPLIRSGSSVADVGSGAGLPGLVLAIVRPDAHFILIEPMERRVSWLSTEAARLELDNVTVVRARAEDVASSMQVDQLTARAVAALSKLLPLVVPLVVPGGELLLLKGANVDREVAGAEKTIKQLKLQSAEVATLGEGVVAEPTRIFRATVRPTTQSAIGST